MDAESSEEYKVTLVDVVVGEVWVCSGQSNMGISVGQLQENLTSWDKTISSSTSYIEASSDFPDLRFIMQATNPSDVEVYDVIADGWYIGNATSGNIGGFSAVCYTFGLRLHEKLDVPIGLVEIQVGGTAVELWSSKEALEKCDQTRNTRFISTCGSKAYPPAEEDSELFEGFSNMLFEGDWREEEVNDDVTNVNSTLWNGMVSPWTKMSIKGVIWYQGESNVACNVSTN